MRKWYAYVCAAACALTLFSGCGEKAATSTVYDRDGAAFATVGADTDGGEYNAYADVVQEEMIALLMRIHDCNEAKAKTLLKTNTYHIYTAFDKRAFTAMNETLSSQKDYAVGCALTDLSGNLLAVYSGGDQTNHALTPRSPHSSFKPLSVYMQAIESGKAHWSKMYLDAPVKQISDESGGLQDWPQNATGKYTMRPTAVRDAVAQSLNTVAVSCLMDVGVKQSLNFLQEKLDMPVAAEQKLCDTYGEEEMVGNVALGYLTRGLTPIEMAGYYQIFASGGSYTAPKAITKVCDVDGNTLYTREDKAQQVISPPTAQVMNRLLREVVSSSGTGADAALPQVQIAGKTGTGDGNTDNWFVGVTPHYSMAVWHGQYEENRAPAHFAAVTTQVYEAIPQANTNFLTVAPLERVIFCGESGMAIADGCTQSEIGYYVDGTAPAVCERH